MPDPRRQRIVHRRVTEGTLDADRGEPAIRIEEPGDADDRVELQQGQRGRGRVEIDLASFQTLDEGGRQRIDVHLETDRERCPGRDARSDAAQCLAGDGTVELKSVSPERLIAESVETKDLSTFPENRSPCNRLQPARWRSPA